MLNLGLLDPLAGADVEVREEEEDEGQGDHPQVVHAAPPEMEGRPPPVKTV
jgi:hypothetical protein